mmetsp:Transcript_24783/g.47536  ORF Transcript_24783/g.47536 Transcript_24783/m.47536 type:complete len:266 (-) Transcript_24783:851-1648(-)
MHKWHWEPKAASNSQQQAKAEAISSSNSMDTNQHAVCGEHCAQKCTVRSTVSSAARGKKMSCQDVRTELFRRVRCQSSNFFRRVLSLFRCVEAFHEMCRVLVRVEGNLPRVGTVNVAVAILIVQQAWLHLWRHPQLLQAVDNELVLTGTPNSTTILDVIFQIGGSLPGYDLDWSLQTIEPRTVLQEDIVPAISMAWHVQLEVVSEPNWKPDSVGINLNYPVMFRQFFAQLERFPSRPKRHSVQWVCHGPLGDLCGAYGPSGCVQG